MNRYAGKKVVIIGGTSGIGLATAKILIDGGAGVLVTGHSQVILKNKIAAVTGVSAIDSRSFYVEDHQGE